MPKSSQRTEHKMRITTQVPSPIENVFDRLVVEEKGIVLQTADRE
jgi:hypothetical protein